MPNDWVSSYYVFNLLPTLTDLGASDSEASKLLLWFRETAPEWVGQFATAYEFAKYVRARLRIKLAQTKINTASLAVQVIEKLFANEDDVTLQDVLDSVALIIPAKPFPFETRVNGDTTLVDLEKAILKVDKQFFKDVLQPLYPFEVRGAKDFKLIKRIPLGLDVEREVNLFDLACWYRFPSMTKDERKKSALHSADSLDWTQGNLYSRLEEGDKHDRYQQRVAPIPDKDDGQLIPCMTVFDPVARKSVPVTAARNTYTPMNPHEVDWDFIRTPSDFGAESA